MSGGATRNLSFSRNEKEPGFLFMPPSLLKCYQAKEFSVTNSVIRSRFVTSVQQCCDGGIPEISYPPKGTRQGYHSTTHSLNRYKLNCILSTYSSKQTNAKSAALIPGIAITEAVFCHHEGARPPATVQPLPPNPRR